MGAKKPYILAIIIVAIYTGMYLISKAAFNHGMNSFVFVFYRQAAASLLLLPIALVLERKNVQSMSLGLLLKLFFLGLIGMEVVKLRSSSGIAKVTSVALCLAGALVIAFYIGPSLNPINHHRAFGGASAAHALKAPRHGTWIIGTFLMVLSNVTWSLWMVLQAMLLKEYPNKMLITTVQCVFSMVQSFVVAAVAERDFTKWKLQLDVSLIAVAYTGFAVTGVSYYLQAWCVEIKGPVFLAVWNPLCFVLTILCSSFLGEIVHLGSIVGGFLLVCGLYVVLWGKSMESEIFECSDNTIHGVQDGQEHKDTAQVKKEPGKEEQETSASSRTSVILRISSVSKHVLKFDVPPLAGFL